MDKDKELARLRALDNAAAMLYDIFKQAGPELVAEA